MIACQPSETRKYKMNAARKKALLDKRKARKETALFFPRTFPANLERNSFLLPSLDEKQFQKRFPAAKPKHTHLCAYETSSRLTSSHAHERGSKSVEKELILWPVSVRCKTEQTQWLLNVSTQTPTNPHIHTIHIASLLKTGKWINKM